MDKKILTGIIASLGASLCCITPVLAVLAGSAGLASTFSWLDPFRPYFTGEPLSEPEWKNRFGLSSRF